MSYESTRFEIKSCEVRYYGPHRTIAGRVTGVVRVIIEEQFLGNISLYPLDLKVKADVGAVSTPQVRTALLAHAARQLNRLRARHVPAMGIAAE